MFRSGRLQRIPQGIVRAKKSLQINKQRLGRLDIGSAPQSL